MGETMTKLVLVRHGQSQWNLENRFTGWKDVDITEAGIAEARKGARALMKAGFDFDLCYTSVLKRAIRTLWVVLDEMDRRSEEHTSELQSLMRISYAVFCLKKKTNT